MAGLVDYGAPQAVAWLGWLIASFVSDDLGVVFLVLFPLAAVWTVVQKVREGKTTQSLGKQLAGTRLVRASTGEPVGPRTAVWRAALHVLDGLPCCFGYLMPIWDSRCQTFADKLAKTVVVTA